MAKIFYDRDADLSLLDGKTIGVLGYGSQGHAQAQNLRDSGCSVIVAELPDTPAWHAAKKAGFTVNSAAEVAHDVDIIIMTISDELQPQVFQESLKGSLKKGKVLQFAHGFNIYYRQILPPPDIDVIIVAPKIHGVLLRKLYTEGSAPPGSVGVFQDASGKAFQVALAMAKGIGLTRTGVVETTFKEEVVTDIFNEQCGIGAGIVGLLKAGFEVLVEAGYGEETAYLELFNEVKGVADLIHDYGALGMIKRCSLTAQYGIMLRQFEIIDDSVKQSMRKILREIEDGSFAHKWLTEGKIGYPNFRTLLSLEEEHPAEVTGNEVRKSLASGKK